MDKDKIICSGCSFTWGQGLWSYLETDKYVPTFHEYINRYPIPTEGQILREQLRWPKLVANHFNLEEVIKPGNGGTDNESLEFLSFLLNENDNKRYLNHFGQQRKLDNCEWIIFQTTQLYRSPFNFDVNGQLYRIKSSPNLRNLTEIEKIKYEENDIKYIPHKNFDIFYEWLSENDGGVESFKKRHQEYMINRIESDLKEYSERGIKIGILCWTDEYLDVIKKSEFLSSKFIKFEYNDIEYDCIDYMQRQNEHLLLYKDPNILHDAGKDEHPSKECHEIIAKSVIKYIENHG